MELFNEWSAESTDGRRFYVDPAMILLATADNCSMDSIVYDLAEYVWYMHLAESINLQTRSVWIYFHQIANEIASQMLYTGFYLENNELLNHLIEIIIATNATIYKATDIDFTYIRAESYFIDNKTCTPLPSHEYPPARFWLSIDSKEQFAQLITGVNNE